LLSVYYFKSEDEYVTEYQRIRSQPPASREGIYINTIKTVYFWGPRKKIWGDEKDQARHECTHQLNHILGGFSRSWLEEGLAVYFEGVKRNKNGRLTIGDKTHPRYERFLARVVAQDVIELKRFLQFTLDDVFKMNDKGSYAQAGALVRFFLNSKPGQKYKDQFLEFIRMCYTTPRDPKTWLREIDSLKVFQECFPNVDLGKLEKEFLSGWDK